MLTRHTKGKRFRKRILLVTDAGAAVDTDLLDAVVDSLNREEMRVQVMYARQCVCVCVCVRVSVADRERRGAHDRESVCECG
jgi:alcohol dehydrogenase class IV